MLIVSVYDEDGGKSTIFFHLPESFFAVALLLLALPLLILLCMAFTKSFFGYRQEKHLTKQNRHTIFTQKQNQQQKTVTHHGINYRIKIRSFGAAACALPTFIERAS